MKKKNSSGSSKKKSKLIDKSPTKKSADLLSKLNGLEKRDDEEEEVKIEEIVSETLPSIPQNEVEESLISEDLDEITRIKVLLRKKESEQQSYVFRNIENIFLIDKEDFHNVYLPCKPEKLKRYNFET